MSRRRWIPSMRAGGPRWRGTTQLTSLKNNLPTKTTTPLPQPSTPVTLILFQLAQPRCVCVCLIIALPIFCAAFTPSEIPCYTLYQDKNSFKKVLTFQIHWYLVQTFPDVIGVLSLAFHDCTINLDFDWLSQNPSRTAKLSI